MDNNLVSFDSEILAVSSFVQALSGLVRYHLLCLSQHMLQGCGHMLIVVFAFFHSCWALRVPHVRSTIHVLNIIPISARDGRAQGAVLPPGHAT